MAGIDRDINSSAWMSSVLVRFVIRVSAIVCAKEIINIIRTPNKIESLSDIVISDFMLLVFRLFDPAILICVGEKNPIPMTVINDIDAKANEAESSESTIKWPAKEK
ncbi:MULTISPECIES: hypothetical protein [Pseudomonas]|uniref:hypothetical protein n=1 Tax=Pseudomonas TaxID=286 RepID=UPI001F24B040|nr:hypothetical protein [Pseudomonas sputi]